jgi:hypothetical protein
VGRLITEVGRTESVTRNRVQLLGARVCVGPPTLIKASLEKRLEFSATALLGLRANAGLQNDDVGPATTSSGGCPTTHELAKWMRVIVVG